MSTHKISPSSSGCIPPERLPKSSPHRLTAMGLLITMGIVFGDIGTSPLYVMKTILGVEPKASADFIIGAVSCVIWTLTLQTTFKYVLIALRADNKGEGGILALFALLRRLPRKWLYIVAAIGASALIADGVITPAITVTSAIEGLQSIDAGIPVLPIVVVIISGIFFMQKAGTSKIGKLFGPFMLLWFLCLGVAGVLNIGSCTGILKAFNPVYAARLLWGNPEWFLVLGAVFLCTTGAEALYSDLGHCGRLNISVSWVFVKVMLILNYLGQGAWIISQHGAIPAGANPFYTILPSSLLIPAVIMATGAAIIASQALLSGSFTLFSEAINLNFWPRLKIAYPSVVKGQLYVPVVNWTLYAGCLLTLIIFRTSAHMEAAYGLAITVTMLMTTVLLSLYLAHKGAPVWCAWLFFAVFAAIEGGFFVANLFKFVHGGWFTILIAGIVCGVMLVWRNATRVRNALLEYKELDSHLGILSDISEDREIPKYASNLIYFSRSEDPGKVESKLLYSIINKNPKRADRYWIFTVDHTDDPDTLEYSVRVLAGGKVIHVTLHLGFRIEPTVNTYLRQIIEDLTARGQLDITSTYPSLSKHHVPGDFKFVIIHRLYNSAESGEHGMRDLMLRLHTLLRHLGISDREAYGLDTSSVVVEPVPLLLPRRAPLRRITPRTQM